MITTVKIKKRCGHTVTQVYLGSGFQLPVWERLEEYKECAHCTPASRKDAIIIIASGLLAVTAMYFIGAV